MLIPYAWPPTYQRFRGERPVTKATPCWSPVSGPVTKAPTSWSPVSDQHQVTKATPCWSPVTGTRPSSHTMAPGAALTRTVTVCEAQDGAPEPTQSAPSGGVAELISAAGSYGASSANPQVRPRACRTKSSESPEEEMNTMIETIWG